MHRDDTFKRDGSIFTASSDVWWFAADLLILFEYMSEVIDNVWMS